MFDEENVRLSGSPLPLYRYRGLISALTEKNLRHSLHPESLSFELHNVLPDQPHLRHIHTFTSPIGSSAAKKQGDFGIFTACLTKNQTIRLDCHYPTCKDSTPYTCEFMAADGTLLAERSRPNCSHIIPINRNYTECYFCQLTRKGRVEEKQVVVDYKSAKGRKKIPDCPPPASGLQLHGAPSFLLPVVSLTLWRILAADSQKT